ncbi:MAG: trypsin-like peptidase domain-containing protein [Candidatus Bathyarchaeota archaeon]|nr:trypsin-like peptidase domain-containing protein [Candidatus Bathyarchaeota archaeon]MDH5788069.1 trypsin-like peptidase domain-containing protein [Candidatus Bathyarchaeota archaeon]
MSGSGEPHTKSSAFFILLFAAGLIVGGLITYYIAFQQISELRSETSNLKAQVSKLWGFQNVTYQNITIYQNSTALTELFENVRDSVVLIRGITSQGTVQGSGFVYNYSGTIVVVTNYHVVHETTSMSITFSNGNGYAAAINGTDPYADLAVLLVNAPQEEFKPLEIVSSSTLRVGDPVIAIGNPYGLVGSMTTGVISALGRTIITEEYTGGFAIANIIQTSAPINPGNSGGPLLNYYGKVVGITTAIVEDAQGLGFAVPSNTILKEINYLITEGSYDRHSYLGLNGTDMNYELAQEMGVNVTYGWRVVDYIDPSPAHNAGVLKDDIIIAINGTRIKNIDDLASYLEEKTLPEENIILTVIRQDQTLNKLVELGYRPYPFQ